MNNKILSLLIIIIIIKYKLIKNTKKFLVQKINNIKKKEKKK